MGWFTEQVDARRVMDEEELESAYARLAASVLGKARMAHGFEVKDALAVDVACEHILASFGLHPAEVPSDVEDVFERVEWALGPTGVMTRPVRLTGAWWQTLTGAYLGRLKRGTPVAIVPAGIRGYAYVDPATKKKVAINKKVAASIEPDALCFYRPLPAHNLTPWGLVAYMLRSLGLFDYVSIVVATLVATVVGVAPVAGTKLVFGAVVPSGSTALVGPLVLLLLGMAISQALFNLASSLVSARISTRLKLNLEAAMYARVLLLNPSFFKKESPGSIASRLMGISNLTSSLSKAVFEVGLTALMSFVYVVQIVHYAPSLALPALITFLMEIVAACAVLWLTDTYYVRQVTENAKLSGVTPEILHGIQKIKLAGAEPRAFAYWASYYSEAARANYTVPTLVRAAPSLVPLVASIGVVVLYAIAATSGVASADFMAFNYAFGSASGAIGTFVTSIPLTAMIRPQIYALEPLLQAIPETMGNKRQVESIDGSIDVSNLSFSYGRDLPLVLDDVSIKIRPGEYVAIVGRTGCGKSTLMRILLGFERPDKGAVQYGPYDMEKVDVRSLRRHMGVVLQDGNLFAGDLLANITVANPKATLDDAWEAAELACIADDIRAMPMGMRTLVGANGGGFSGGQRQRIMIARAVCGKPSILMFDEATSALDNVAQKHVSEALDRLDCTRVVIAHRLSTIRSCDRIIMLDGGRIVDEGSYDELVARGGAFAELVRRQRIEGED